jgi:hypothetical protein
MIWISTGLLVRLINSQLVGRKGDDRDKFGEIPGLICKIPQKKTVTFIAFNQSYKWLLNVG